MNIGLCHNLSNWHPAPGVRTRVWGRQVIASTWLLIWPVYLVVTQWIFDLSPRQTAKCRRLLNRSTHVNITQCLWLSYHPHVLYKKHCLYLNKQLVSKVLPFHSRSGLPSEIKSRKANNASHLLTYYWFLIKMPKWFNQVKHDLIVCLLIFISQLMLLI